MPRTRWEAPVDRRQFMARAAALSAGGAWLTISPLAGLLAVAAAIPRERCEVVLTDENIEPIDFDLKADLVGIDTGTDLALFDSLSSRADIFTVDSGRFAHQG